MIPTHVSVCGVFSVEQIVYRQILIVFILRFNIIDRLFRISRDFVILFRFDFVKLLLLFLV